MPETLKRLDASMQEAHIPAESEASLDVFMNPKILFDGLSSMDRMLSQEVLEDQTRAWIANVDMSGYVMRSISNHGKNENEGVPKASSLLGSLINTNNHQGQLQVATRTEYFYDERRELTLEEYDKLIAAAPNQGFKLMAGLLKDIAYPRQDDGTYPVLQPSAIVDVNKSQSFGNDRDKVLCGDAEGRFMEAAYQLQEVKIGDRTVALRKFSGEDTALLVEDSLLNGVLIPKGSIMIVDNNPDGTPTFLFGRLSAFSVDSPAEIERMAPALTTNEHFRSNAWNYGKIRELLGENTHVGVARLEAFIAEVDAFESGDSEFGRIARTLANKEKSITARQEGYDQEIKALDDVLEATYKGAPSSYESTMTDYQKSAIITTNTKKQEDYAQLRALRKSINNPRVAYTKAYRELGRIFGPEKVAEVVGLVAERAKAKQIIAGLIGAAENDQQRRDYWAEKHSAGQRRVDLEHIDSAVKSDKWKELVPNFMSDSDLLPSEIGSVHILDMITELRQHETPDVFVVEGLGQVSKTAEDGLNSVYVLTTPEGKKMALKKLNTRTSGSYDAKVADNYINKSRLETESNSTFEYSDLRTYIEVRIDADNVFVMQEYGGAPAEGGIRKAIAARRAYKNIIEKLPNLGAQSKRDIRKKLGQSANYVQKSLDGKVLLASLTIRDV